MFPRGTPLSVVVDKMITTHVHRLALQEKATDMAVVDVVTQSNIINFIDGHSKEFASPWMHRTVAELGLGSDRVRRVKSTDLALQAFIALRDANVQALAVVDAHDNFVGSISVGNLRVRVVDSPPVTRRADVSMGTTSRV
jgi:hypothetical protein